MEGIEIKNGGQQKITLISREKLIPGPTQPRTNFNDERLEELALSIKVHGILQPLIVRAAEGEGGCYEIIAGERRWRAAKIARLKKVPCIIMHLVNEQALAVALVENIQREDLNPIEEAQAYVRLRDTLMLNQDQLAERVGKDRSSIANTLRLLRLPKAIQEMVINGELSMGHARALLSLDSSDMMLMVAKKTFREGLSVRRLEGIIRSLKRGVSLFESKKDASNEESALEREIKHRIEYELGVKVILKREQQGYALTMQFQTAEALNSLLDRLGVEI